jgi:putative NIF3 family GTP cyclohydrolase 1 type 2
MNVREVVDQIIAACHLPPAEQTCDVLAAGDWGSEVTGIVTTFMATADVIRDAVSKGANLIITHEPTYFTGADDTGWLQHDDVYLLKRKLIEDHQINIWRFHDHMHWAKPDMIYTGVNQELGWSQYTLPGRPHCYVIPAISVGALAAFFKEKLNVNVAQIVGDPDLIVRRLGILVGGGSLGYLSEQTPMTLMRDEQLDAIVCGEILEWTLVAYVRDAAQLGLKKALIILGHNRTEEAGMKHLPEWLRTALPDIPVQFSEAGEPFAYV